MATKTGKILKGVGGFYYVETSDGIFECRARGKFRKEDLTPYVGDNVVISVEDSGLGYVCEIFERKNSFIRPPVANIDKLVVVVALKDPVPDTLFIDKMLVIAECADVKPALCFNKSDLCDDELELCGLYKNAGYDVFITSTKNETGIDELEKFIQNSVTAVCGFSGVGKSSIMNILTDSKDFEVGEISSKLSRGKHTTRHVELIKLNSDTFLADTPGFSSLSLPDSITGENLINYFPELNAYTDNCKFADCRHISDKFCSVYDAVVKEKISSSRYNNYRILYDMIKDNKEWKK